MSNGNGAEKRALLIGVNKYPKLASRYQLRGCVNDVDLMASILRDNFGFPEGNVKVLRDEEATHDGILAAMDALAKGTGQDDIVVVHYSGHGSQRTTKFPNLEPDGLDETIVPHDSGRGRAPNLDIIDKEIYAWLLRLRDITPYVTFIFDCCHSGTITRDTFGAQERWVEPDRRPLDEMQSPELQVDLGAATEASRDLGDSGWLPLAERYVLIAGCHDEESSFEHRVIQGGGVVRHGALTYFLGQELVSAKSGTTYRDVFERASAQVTAAHRRQHPQMEGARDRELFGVTEIEPLHFVQITARRGNRVTLAAGAAHGLTAGSEWAIYPQATKEVTEETPKLGLVEIKAVRAVTSDAEIVEEPDAGAIVPNTRAVEESHSYGEMRLVVEIEAPAEYGDAVADLAALLDDSDLLRQAEEGEAGEVRAYVIAPRGESGEDDPAPQLGALGEATWAVVGEDGRLMMPPHAVTEGGVAYTLRDNLEKAVRYRQALALKNPNEESPLRDQVSLVLMRLDRDGNWVEAEPVEEGGQVAYEEEDQIAFRITNKYSAPIYVSVLDFGLRGGISLLHPIEGASEKLAAGNTLEVGVREGDEMDLYLPEGFGPLPDPGDGTPRGGKETFKLFATTHPADFSLLAQEGYRAIDRSGLRGADSPLVQLLDMALTGQGTRAVRRRRLAPDEEWTTVERSFFLAPRGI
jgi:hypothetical protein